jgi:GNAT superfamily N-acetyltransferase
MSPGTQSLTDSIRAATAADLAEMARIHAGSGVPGLLSDLGEAFLRDVYYRGLLISPVGQARVIEIGGRVVGLVTYSSDSSRLFGQIFRRRIFATVLALARAGLRRPRVLLDFIQSVLTVERSSAGSDIAAEIVSLEIAPDFQGLGLGFILLKDAVTALRDAGVTRIKARILANHSAVERLYLPLGFHEEAPFRLHGRDWRLMVFTDAN